MFFFIFLFFSFFVFLFHHSALFISLLHLPPLFLFLPFLHSFLSLMNLLYTFLLPIFLITFCLSSLLPRSLSLSLDSFSFSIFVMPVFLALLFLFSLLTHLSSSSESCFNLFFPFSPLPIFPSSSCISFHLSSLLHSPFPKTRKPKVSVSLKKK